MKIVRYVVALTLAGAGLTAAPVVPAQDQLLPPAYAESSVTYISGGVGSGEAAALRQVAPSYPLTLELAAPSGGWRDEYIANAQVEIRDQQGHTLLSTQAEGPLFLIRIPTGHYTVQVAWNGTVRRRGVDVSSDKPQHLFFEFPNDNTG